MKRDGIGKRQIRMVCTDFTTREDGEDPIIEGYFAVFNSIYDIGYGMSESIAPGAFEGTPDLVFGGPALSDAGGSILLRDARGHVADALNFGLLVDPWLSEGYQADSGANEPGNFAPTPSAGRRGGFGPVVIASTSAGRFPDGADADDNKKDFQVQRTLNMSLPVAAGADNIKLANVQWIRPGASLVIGKGAEAQTVQVTGVGSAGATVLSAAAGPGTRTIAVGTAQGFIPGQEVLVGDEKAVVAEVIIPRGWRLPPAQQQNKLVLQAPLRKAHKAADPVSGTGVSLSAPLKAAFAPGTPVATAQPTPGAPNRY